MSTLQDGVAALHMASQEGHEEIVRLLLQSGAKDRPANVSINMLSYVYYLVGHDEMSVFIAISSSIVYLISLADEHIHSCRTVA